MAFDREPTLQQIIAGMASRFRPEAAPGLRAVLQFRLTGTQGADFYATVVDDSCEVLEGIHSSPTLTLKMSAETYIDMVMGRVTGQQAFFNRKLRYEGPIALAVKLHKFFKPPDLD